MKSWIYPVNGDLKRNVRVTMLPEWTVPVFGNKFLFIPAFGRLWASAHLSPILHSSDDLARFDAFVAGSYEHLRQQRQFPLCGIGWWIERWGSKLSKLHQDFAACVAYLRSFHKERRWAAAQELVLLRHEFAELIAPRNLIADLLNAANSPSETGGM